MMKPSRRTGVNDLPPLNLLTFDDDDDAGQQILPPRSLNKPSAKGPPTSAQFQVPTLPPIKQNDWNERNYYTLKLERQKLPVPDERGRSTGPVPQRPSRPKSSPIRQRLPSTSHEDRNRSPLLQSRAQPNTVSSSPYMQIPPKHSPNGSSRSFTYLSQASNFDNINERSPSIRITEIDSEEEPFVVGPSNTQRSRSNDSSRVQASTANIAIPAPRHRTVHSLGDEAWRSWASESHGSLSSVHRDKDHIDDYLQVERRYEIWHPTFVSLDHSPSLKPYHVSRSPSVSSTASRDNAPDLSLGSINPSHSDISRSPSNYRPSLTPHSHHDQGPTRPPKPESNYTRRSREGRNELIGRLAGMLADKEEYKKLVARKGLAAQRLLDMFQRLLDVMKNPPPKFQEQLIVAMQRLAVKSKLYPTCYELDDVTDPNTTEDSGRFADIYKAKLQGRTVCLKVIRRTSQTNVDHLLKATAKEAILWGQLRHPNVVPFYGIYRIKQTISFVSPWMENGNILTFLKKRKDSNRVILAFDIAQGLKFLHKNGIIHGDLKGANILVNDLERVCLADFGLSSVSDKEVLNLSAFSTNASKGGTARWQAPELLNPEVESVVPNTKCSDIYAWSLVAYEIFAGEVPFGKILHELKVMRKVLDGQRPSRPPGAALSWKVWGLTKEIWSLMESCWSADPAKRPTIDVVKDQLEMALPQGTLKEAGHAGHLSPGKFREMTRLDNEEKVELSVDALESILND